MRSVETIALRASPADIHPTTTTTKAAMDAMRNRSNALDDFPPLGTVLPYDAWIPVVWTASDGSRYVAGWVFGDRYARIEAISAAAAITSGVAILSLILYLAVSRPSVLRRAQRCLRDHRKDRADALLSPWLAPRCAGPCIAARGGRTSDAVSSNRQFDVDTASVLSRRSRGAEACLLTIWTLGL